MSDNHQAPNLAWWQRSQEIELGKDYKDQRQRTVSSDATVAHDFQYPIFRPTPAKAIEGICQSVLVKTVRDERREDDRAKDRRRRRQQAVQQYKNQRRSATDDHTNERKEGGRLAEFCFRTVERSPDR